MPLVATAPKGLLKSDYVDDVAKAFEATGGSKWTGHWKGESRQRTIRDLVQGRRSGRVRLTVLISPSVVNPFFELSTEDFVDQFLAIVPATSEVTSTTYEKPFESYGGIRVTPADGAAKDFPDEIMILGNLVEASAFGISVVTDERLDLSLLSSPGAGLITQSAKDLAADFKFAASPPVAKQAQRLPLFMEKAPRPPFDLARWNYVSMLEHRSLNNCYNYAANKPTFTWAQPGRSRQQIFTSTKDIVKKLVEVDGLKTLPKGALPLPDAEEDSGHAVALFLKKDGRSFHFFRQDPDGHWSHKNGDYFAQRRNKEGKLITTKMLPGAFGDEWELEKFFWCDEPTIL